MFPILYSSSSMKESFAYTHCCGLYLGDMCVVKHVREKSHIIMKD